MMSDSNQAAILISYSDSGVIRGVATIEVTEAAASYKIFEVGRANYIPILK